MRVCTPAAKTMKCLPTILTLLGSVTAASAAVSPVYPTPQQCTLKAESTKVTEVKIQHRAAKAKGDIWTKLPEKEGAYAIRITPGKLEVYVNTDKATGKAEQLGVYYAKQTVSQLLKDVPGAKDAQRDPFPGKGIKEVAQLGELPCGTIIDWPDLAYRGTVEGYYGIPWGGEARKSQFAFYGRNKMNYYLYAPKDDPYHHGGGCYELYPADKAAELKDQITCARKNHVRFVWGIHPANTVKWGENGGKKQLDGLCTKLQQLYDLGVRDFAVLVDDSGGEICKPERQVQLCNYILENFIRKHPDVNQDLVMCPTGYNRSWTNPDFLGKLGNGLDKSIHVMWTGDTVVHDITLSGQQWVHEKLGRPTFIWWNWPCSDFKASRLSMGRTYGNGQEEQMRKEMTGFVANPMERAEASKVGLFGVADYTWNICGFDSENSWHQGIDRLYPTCADAMQVFCKHNSWLLPNGHGYYREESVGIADDAKAYTESLKAGKADLSKVGKLQDEYKEIAKAAKAIRKAPGMETLQKEIANWIDAFEYTGQAGSAALSSLEEKDTAKALQQMLKAADKMYTVANMERTAWRNGSVQNVKGVEVAMLAMTPAITETLNYVNSRVYGELSGRKGGAGQPVFTASLGDPQKDARNISDGDPGTLWHSGCGQGKECWIGLDCGGETDIRTVNLQMGGRYAKDFIPRGQMEYSTDGKDWKPMGPATAGASVAISNETPVHARYLRYRSLETAPNWLSVCEFTVNRRLPATVKTTIPGLAAASTYRDDKSVGLNRIFEVAKAAPGSTIELILSAPRTATWLEVELDNASVADWAKVELNMGNGKYREIKPAKDGKKLVVRTNAMPKEPVAGFRLTHTGSAEQEVKLNTFKLDMPADDPATDPYSLSDTDLTSAYDLSRNALDTTLEVPGADAGKPAKTMLVIGDGTFTADGAKLLKTDGRVHTLEIAPGTSTVTLKAPKQEGKRINEVIFKN